MICCLAFAGSSQALDRIIFDQPSSAIDSRKEYPMQLLREILERTKTKFGPYELQYSDVRIEQRPRLLLEMKRGEVVNVTVQPSQPEWETELPVIRLPVDKGIASYRIFLINQEDQPAFSAITSLDQLKAKRLGIDRAWSTYAIHVANGFNLETGNNYEGLFSMLLARRFDYFPRAIYEAIPEQLGRKDSAPNIAVEKSIALYFPLPRYFFVSPAHPQLAKRIEAGFEMIIKDGTFDRLFMEFHRDLIKQAEFCSRRIFPIPNPFLTPQTPLQRKELWFDPFRAGKKGQAVCSNHPSRPSNN
ncbi:MAG: hypothetical protein JWL63_2037 [Rhodocyclales bacterium]|nr:hypothetical protein [Rhodocyclales bacterium]